MKLTLHPLRGRFAAEVGPIDLRQVHDPETLSALRKGMDDHAVLVFREQFFTDEEHLAFGSRLDGVLHQRPGINAMIQKQRLSSEALSDVSNLDENGKIFEAGDHRRFLSLSNRLWHTDASFFDPPGRYSMLSAKEVPPVGAETELADMRAAYDALLDETRAELEGLRVVHSILHSRWVLGFEASKERAAQFRGAIHPLVRTIPRSNRKALYLAAHASEIVGMPVPEGRILLHDLIEHATQPQFVYRHTWRVGDLVIWDNRCTMHRGRPFEATKYRRDLRRVTTLDIAGADA